MKNRYRNINPALRVPEFISVKESTSSELRNVSSVTRESLSSVALRSEDPVPIQGMDQKTRSHPRSAPSFMLSVGCCFEE